MDGRADQVGVPRERPAVAGDRRRRAGGLRVLQRRQLAVDVPAGRGPPLVSANGSRFHVVEAGTGPMVLLHTTDESTRC